MSFPQRLMVFCFGIGLGALLSLYILRNRGLPEREGPPESLAEAETEAVPGLVSAYEDRREPLRSNFITGEYRSPGPKPGTYRRVYIIEGRQPGQRLRVEEIQRSDKDGAIEVESWHITAADRVVMTLAEGTEPSSLREPLATEGYRLLRRGSDADSYIVTLDSHTPRAVDMAIERIAAFGPQVITVTPEYLDKPSDSL